MRAAAELAGEGLLLLAHRDDAHALAVLLTKEGNGTGGLGLVDAHLDRHHGFGGKDLTVDKVLDGMELLGGESVEMRKVKAQVVGSHERTGLVHVVAEHLFKGSVEQVGRSVVATQQLTAVMVDARGNDITLVKLARLNMGNVGVQTTLALGIRNRDLNTVGVKRTGIAHLTTHLCVEGSAVENDLDVLTGVRRVDALAVTHHCENAGTFKGVSVIAAELSRGKRVGELGPDVVERAPRIALNVGTCALSLGLHLAVETVYVDRMSRALGNLDRKVNGETKGVVEHKGGRTVERLALAELSKSLVKVNTAVAERVGEALLLSRNDALDERCVLNKLGVRIAHELVHAIDESREESALDANEATVEHGAAQQAAEHIAAPLVAGQDAIGDRLRLGPV